MTTPKRSEDRNYTPKAELPPGNLPEEAEPQTIRPDERPDQGDESIADDLDVGPEDPGVDLNIEQQR